MNFPTWDKIAWFVFLGVAFGLEFLGIFDTQYETLTALICSVVPPWARALALGWIVWHFLIQHPN